MKTNSVDPKHLNYSNILHFTATGGIYFRKQLTEVATGGTHKHTILFGTKISGNKINRTEK
jgi:hypothetical protein